MKKLLVISIIQIWISQNLIAQVANDNIGSGNCLDFDGTTNFINVPDNNTLSFGNTLTLEAWIQTAQSKVAPRIFDKETVGSVWPEYQLYMNADGTITFSINSGNTNNIRRATTAGSYNDNQWHHVAATYDGATMRIYIDGEEDATLGAGITLWNGPSPLQISGAPGSGDAVYRWDGQMDDARMWNVTRSQTQIRDNMCTQLAGNEAGLVAYWNMNEGTGTTVTDLTANSNNGTAQ